MMKEELLAAVPLFIFMGFITEQAGLMERLFSAFRMVLAPVRGSLYIVVIVTSTVFAMATGLGVPADATTILANYGTDRLRYLAPTWIGDTLYLDIEVTEKTDRDEKTGLVTYRWDVLNQNGVTVCASQLKILTAKERPAYAGI